MNVDLYERIWMWGAAVIVVVFLVAIGVSTFAYAVRPPSHVETIDPAAVMQDARFSTPGVTTRADGSVQVVMVAMTFAFLPNEVHVPAGRPVTFRITSMDVTHGFEIAGTNANTMVVPGYVSQFTTTFAAPGEHLVVCNEYCGTGHHTMQGKVIVDPAPGAAPAPAAAPAGAGVAR
ncbi:MAG TPA: cytochrome c oxidase subunit II [Gemmatimonadales bacterium]|nr:cytochrome c oxidase subunit II [Gemmatimonadales bacterium]